MDDSLIPMHCDASGHDGGVALKKRKPRAKRAAVASTTAAMAEFAAVAGAGTPATIIHGAVEASPLAVPQSTEATAAHSDEPPGDPHGTLVDGEPIPAELVAEITYHLDALGMDLLVRAELDGTFSPAFIGWDDPETPGETEVSEDLGRMIARMIPAFGYAASHSHTDRGTVVIFDVEALPCN